MAEGKAQRTRHLRITMGLSAALLALAEPPAQTAQENPSSFKCDVVVPAPDGATPHMAIRDVPAAATVPTSGPAAIDVLFVYYPYWLDWTRKNYRRWSPSDAPWLDEPNSQRAAEQLVSWAVERFNGMALDSKLPLSVRSVGVIRAPGDLHDRSRQLDAVGDLGAAADHPVVRAERARRRADVVTLITGSGEAFVWTRGLSAEDFRGFAYHTMLWHGQTDWIFAHEMGHVLGLAHTIWDGYSYMPYGAGWCGTVDGKIGSTSGSWLADTLMYDADEKGVPPERRCFDGADEELGISALVFSSASTLSSAELLYRGGERITGSLQIGDSETDAVRAIRHTMHQVAAFGEALSPGEKYTDCEPTSVQIGFSHGYAVSACFEYERDGEIAKADAVDYRLDARESGLLYFFDRDNAEVLIKVLDACAINGHRWVFVAPVTDLALNLEVREIATGKRWRYRNPRGGQTAKPRSDTAAFPCDAAAASWAIAEERRGYGQSRGANQVEIGVAGPVTKSGERQVVRNELPAHSGDETDCEPGSPALTLRGGYTVSMCYETSKGEVGHAVDWGLNSEQSGLLYFFDRDNVEVLLKVLDGCGVNGHRWVFVAPVTNLAFNLRVESPDGEMWTHTNRLGQTAAAASDTSAFPCAPSS